MIGLIDRQDDLAQGRSPGLGRGIELVKGELHIAGALNSGGIQLDIIKLTIGRAGKGLSPEMVGRIGVQVPDP